MNLDYGDFSISDTPREGVKKFEIDIQRWFELSKAIRIEQPIEAIVSDFMLRKQTEALAERSKEAHVATMVACILVLLWLHGEHCSDKHKHNDLIPASYNDCDFTLPDEYPIDVQLISAEVLGAKLFAEATMTGLDADRAGTFLLCHIAPVFEQYKALDPFPSEIDA